MIIFKLFAMDKAIPALIQTANGDRIELSNWPFRPETIEQFAGEIRKMATELGKDIEVVVTYDPLEESERLRRDRNALLEMSADLRAENSALKGRLAILRGPPPAAAVYCKQCGVEILWTGKFWEHVNSKPRHPGVPT